LSRTEKKWKTGNRKPETGNWATCRFYISGFLFPVFHSFLFGSGSARIGNRGMADQPIPVEMEAKLLVPTTTDLRAIARLTHLGAYPLRARGAVRLHTSYLDTPNLALARNGVAVRLRRQGRHWEATVKWAGRVEGDVHERPELTIALPRPPALPFLPPPGPLYTQLAALVAGRPLAPILISEIHRRLFDVLPSDPAAPLAATPTPLAELALDRVRLHAPQEGQAETTYCEVEVERRSGDRRDLTTLASLLQQGFGLLPSSHSKFARGLTLLYGTGILGSGDQHVLAYDTTQEAVRRIVARHLHRLRLHDPGVRTGEDPEALHDMRVATRRLRAALRIFAAGMPTRLQTRMTAELQWLGGLLGGVRDLDVQLAKLDAFTAAAPAGFRPALGCLHDYLDSERSRHRAAMLAGLDTARYFRLLIQLERFAYSPAPRRPRDAAALEPIAAAGRRAIKQAFRRLMKRGAKIEAMPRPEDLHALRIRAKRLRYLLEFLQELTGKAGRRLVKRLTELQDLLGSYHDAVVAAEFVRTYVECAGAQLPPASMVALGALVASELRRAEQKRADFEHAWRRFTRKRTVEACDAVLRRLRGTLSPPPAPEPVTPPVQGGAS
jgi:inorganic triphosphatase YgiF